MSRPAIVKCLCSSLRDSVLCAADLWEMILECLIDADDSVCAVAFMTVEALLEAHLTSLSRDDCSIGNALVSAVLGWMASKYAALEERARRLYGEHRLSCLVPLAHAAGSLPKEVRGSLTKVLAHDLLLPELQVPSEQPQNAVLRRWGRRKSSTTGLKRPRHFRCLVQLRVGSLHGCSCWWTD